MIAKSSKYLAALAFALLVSAGAAQAADKLVRVDHPRGGATYIYRSTSEPTDTIAVYAGQGPSPTVYRKSERTERTVPVHQGRGQTRYTKVVSQ